MVVLFFEFFWLVIGRERYLIKVKGIGYSLNGFFLLKKFLLVIVLFRNIYDFIFVFMYIIFSDYKIRENFWFLKKFIF